MGVRELNNKGLMIFVWQFLITIPLKYLPVCNSRFSVDHKYTQLGFSLAIIIFYNISGWEFCVFNKNVKTLFSYNKERVQRLVTFFVIILGASIAMKLSSVKDAFYEPMRDIFDLSHAEFGATRSIYGVVQMLGYIPAMFIADRFSKKIMIPFSLVALAFVGLYFASIPGYIGLLLVFALLAIFGEMTYWPIMLKTVRLLGNDSNQGRMYGFLEGGRGVCDVIIAFAALAIFAWLGEGVFGLQSAIYFYSALLIMTAIISYKLLEHDVIDTSEGVIAGSKRILVGIKQELHKKELWLLAFTVFFIWTTYAGLTSFVPFLKDIYGLPIVLVGIYGIMNQYALKFVGGPAAGILADKYFKSPLKTMRFAFVGGIIGLIILRLYPHDGSSVTLGMILTLSMASFIFMLRALAFSPMAELKIPKERTGSALALVCLIGYSANIFAYAMYGKIIDTYPGIQGYNFVFMIMIGTLSMAFILSSLAFNIVKNKQKIEGVNT